MTTLNSVYSLCESKDYNYSNFLEAVEEFVDSEIDNPLQEHYIATAKRLLGEMLSHDEIMLDIPDCSPSDLVMLERASHDVEVNYSVSLDTKVKTMLSRLKLGRGGLESLVKTYKKLVKDNPSATKPYMMGKAATMHGIDPRQGQIILTKTLRNNEAFAEYYYRMAENVLVEETPTNTQGSGMPHHEATDGKATGKMQRRKKDKEYVDKDDADEK